MTKKSSKKQTLVDTEKELNEKRVYKTGLLMESEVPSSLLLMVLLFFYLIFIPFLHFYPCPPQHFNLHLDRDCHHQHWTP